MTRTIMISDVHGCVKQLDQLLEKIEYRSTRDQLILLGDYVDRGPQSRETLDRVIDLVTNQGAIALRGNHDQRLLDLIRTNDKQIQAKFIEHGGLQTLQSYCDFISDEITDETLERSRLYIEQNYAPHIEFLHELPFFYEDEQHIYVHAGLNPHYLNWRDQPTHDFMYIKNDFIRTKTRVDKRVIFGHTRTVDLQETSEVWFQEDKIGIDGGCAYGLQLNALIYENGIYTTSTVKGQLLAG